MNYETPRKNITGLSFIIMLHLVAAGIAVHNSKILINHEPERIIDVLKEQLPLKELPKTPDEFKVPKFDPPIHLEKLVIESEHKNVITEEHPPRDNGEKSQGGGGGGGGGGDGGGSGEGLAHTPVKVAPVIDAGACSKPDYPKAALRNGDAGTVLLAFLIGKDGKVAGAKVEQSSGFRDLDRAALNGLSLCRFKPGTVDGVAYESWTRMQYVWSVNE